MVGSKLKLARSAAGLSLRGLEDRIAGRVTAQAIGKYERSESVPSSGVLIALAEGLGVSVEYLTTSNRGLALDAVEFRDKTILTKRDQVRVQAQAADLLERYLAVEELLALPTVDWDKPREAPYPVVDDLAAVDHGALSLRMHWDVGAQSDLEYGRTPGGTRSQGACVQPEGSGWLHRLRTAWSRPCGPRHGCKLRGLRRTPTLHPGTGVGALDLGHGRECKP